MRTKKRLLYKLITLMVCLGMLLSTASLPVTADAIEDTTGSISNEQQSDTSENVLGEQKDDTSENVLGEQKGDASENASDKQQGDNSENVSDKQTGDDSKAARSGGDGTDPADSSPKSFDVQLDFLSRSPGLAEDCSAGADVRYYIGGARTVDDGPATADKDGVTDIIPLESGRIYMLQAGMKDAIPDMGGVTLANGGAELWIYVSEDGPKLVTADNFDKLMEDQTFNWLIGSFLKTDECMSIVGKYATAKDMGREPTEARLQELLKEHVCTFVKDIALKNADGTYKLALKFSKREINPLKITVVDEKGNPLPGIRYRISDFTGNIDNQDYTSADGVVFNSPEGEEVPPIGLYTLTVNGASKDATSTTYIRKNAKDAEKYPADTYGLMIYVGPESIEVVTPDNYDELSKDFQFRNTIQTSLSYMGSLISIKELLMTYPGVSTEGEEIELPFIPWKNRPTVSFKTVDQNDGSLDGIAFSSDSPFHTTGTDDHTTGTDGICTVTVPAPGLWSVGARDKDYEYMASHEMFRYNRETNRNSNNGRYEICLWVTLDGKVELVDDAKLKELCKDPAFIDMMTISDRRGYGFESMMWGTKADYKALKNEYYIPGNYTLDKVKINGGNDEAYVLPFTNDWDKKLEGTKDEAVVIVREGHYNAPDNTPSLTYKCPETGAYLVGWKFQGGNVSLKIQRPDGSTINVPKNPYRIQLEKDVNYTFDFDKAYNWDEGYLDVFVEKKADISPDADLRTADYIKDGSKYSNMVSFSCGNETEHMILARYPGDLKDGYSWAFNVALPSGTDYTKGSLKVQYLRDPATDNDTPQDPGYAQLKDNLPADKLVTLDVDHEWIKAKSFSDKTICSMSLDKADGLKAGDLMVITYSGKVNTAAWYGSILDSNMSYGYWSIQDADGSNSETFDKLIEINPYDPADNDDALADPAICQVFGIKIYKYSNYDRMVSQSPGEFDQDVLLQEHLLNGAEFKLEGENLSKIIAIRDDLVELEDQPETELKPALLADAGRTAKVSNGSGAGAALAKLIDEETMMKLLYYRYEQGLQDLSKVSVAQTQTYYALKDDDLYTRVAPESDTMQFYADNGQGYKLKPTAFSAKAGETIKAGDGGGLLLGGLGVGEYTLTEVKAPDGYAKIKPLKISIEWVKKATDDRYDYSYKELDKGEVPDRSGKYGLLCKIDDVATPVLMNSAMGMGDVWYPGKAYYGPNVPSFESIWNPNCYVLVNPIGDDRISFAAVKEVSDPADKDKAFTLKFTIKDPQGNICKDVKYAICQEDGQFETAQDAIPEANGWEYNLKPGEKIAFLNLEEGSTYEVTEENGEYIVSYENNKGTIAYDGNKYPTAVVTNKKGELVISKTVTGTGDTNKAFNFKVELKDGKGNELKDVTCIKGKTESKLSSGGSIQLKHGESATLYVPVGTQYKVTELEANQDGYISSAENDEGTVSADDPVIKAAFVNNKEAKDPDPGNNEDPDPGNNEDPDPGNNGVPDPGDNGVSDPGDNGVSDPGDNGAPRTGDNSNLAVWLMLMILSIIGLSFVLVRCRK